MKGINVGMLLILLAMGTVACGAPPTEPQAPGASPAGVSPLPELSPSPEGDAVPPGAQDPGTPVFPTDSASPAASPEDTGAPEASPEDSASPAASPHTH